MMRSMYAGVSGLKAHQIRMDVIGNNIANVNTIGYKASRVTFKEMLSQTLKGAAAPQSDRGGTNPQQVGLGVGIGSIDVNHTQGNLQTTGIGTDLAIQGNGYFVVSDGQQDYFTRTGALTLDDNGNLVNATNGFILRGWMADTSGSIDTNQSLEGIKIPIGQTMGAKATQEVIFGGNLDSYAPGGDSRTATIDIYDSLGAKHTVSIEFQRLVLFAPTGTDTIGVTTGDLTVNASAADPDLNNLKISFGTDSDAAAAATYDESSHTIIVTGDWDNSAGNQPAALADIENAINTELGAQGFASTVTLATSAGFDATEFDGAPDITITADPANDWAWTVTGITDAAITAGGSGIISFNTDGTINSGGNGMVSLAPAGGAGAQTININFSEDNNSVRMLAGSYTIEGINADGYEKGDLESFTIDENGIITGSYTNGQNKALGQIAIASFSNPSGLVKQGETLFAESENSGIAKIGVAGNGDRGSITSNALEMSNVDLAEQFTDMITTQRGFQANSKIIQTADQMLQDLVNIKR